jgi:hypothetical protein
VKLTVISPKDNVMTAVKRDGSSIDLSTWHRRLGHIGETMLKKMVHLEVVKGMTVMNTSLSGMCKDCILGKMDEKVFSNKEKRDT